MAAPRAPQDRRSPARKSAPVSSLVEITRPTDADDQDEKKIPLFSLDGVIYSVPERVSMTVTLRCLEDLSLYGQEIAVMTAVRAHMGQEAWDALKTCDYLSEEQFSTILGTVMKLIQGGMEKVTAGK